MTYSIYDENNKVDINLFSFAIKKASEWHGDQKRKYTGEPYWHHPVAVANILIHHGVSDTEMLCAAVLHDVLEDTDTCEEILHSNFGDNITGLVLGLTDVTHEGHGNRKTRKSIERDRIAKESEKVKIIKTADLIHNGISIMDNDKKFGKVYFKEINELIPALETKKIENKVLPSLKDLVLEWHRNDPK